MNKIDDTTQQILEKYKEKLASEMSLDGVSIDNDTDSGDRIRTKRVSSREYQQFRSELVPNHFSHYEKACNFCEKILKIAPDQKKLPDVIEAIETAHLNVTPAGVSSFAILAPLAFILITSILSYLVPIAFGAEPSNFFLAFFLLFGVSMMMPLQNVPFFMANDWRLKASNEMVLSVFYIVTYMRHTSNLELALEFAGNHLNGPLALDLKKVIWDIETEKYATLQESLDNYLETWRKWNIEYIESMHLIESSLLESSDERRLTLLDKSLEVMLEETFEKMMHYAHNLKAPMTTLNMLGFVLPILGMVILPLVVNFMGNVKWYYLFMIYDVTIPFAVYYLGRKILASRPTGYGASDMDESNPMMANKDKVELDFFGNKKYVDPKYIAITVFSVFMFIGLLPVILGLAGFKNVPIGVDGDMPFAPEPCREAQYCLLEFREQGGETAGPFDIFPAALSVFVPLALGLSIGLYYKMKTQNVIEMRTKSKELEKEFSSALFQLGNRLGDGLPAEIAFGRVGQSMKSTTSGGFFLQVSQNITRLGMGVKDAIFNRKTGVIFQYPSSIIQSSMKVLVESVKKSPRIASQALISIAAYIKEMHRIDERLKDLLADVISSMKSQSSFLAPVISAIVIGLSSMITNVLGKIGPALQSKGQEVEAMQGMTESFFGIGVPTYYFQIIVGLYVVELIFILTILVNGVENGSDKLQEGNMIGTNLVRGTILYCILALLVMVSFNLVADMVVSNSLGV